MFCVQCFQENIVISVTSSSIRDILLGYRSCNVVDFSFTICMSKACHVINYMQVTKPCLINDMTDIRFGIVGLSDTFFSSMKCKVEQGYLPYSSSASSLCNCRILLKWHTPHCPTKTW